MTFLWWTIFLEMLQSWTGALCTFITDWHPLKLNLCDCFWCKSLSTKLHWALYLWKWILDIWSQSCVYIFYKSCKKCIKWVLFIFFPRCLFRHGLDLSFSFHYLNVMRAHTHTHTHPKSLSSGFQVQFS
jgi:hypothetical protein